MQEIGINEFCQIASEEDLIDERELIKAFRSIDTNQNGYIEYREFMGIFGNVYNNLSTSYPFTVKVLNVTTKSS